MKVGTTLLIAVAALAISNASFAAAGTPVAHVHDGRSHTHPLPATGKNHSHGKKPPAKKATGSISPWFDLLSSQDSLTKVRANVSTLKQTTTDLSIVLEWRSKPYAGGKVTTNYDKAVISLTTCAKEIGLIKFYNINGSLRSTADYVKGGSTMAISIGDNLCYTLK